MLVGLGILQTVFASMRRHGEEDGAEKEEGREECHDGPLKGPTDHSISGFTPSPCPNAGSGGIACKTGVD